MKWVMRVLLSMLLVLGIVPQGLALDKRAAADVDGDGKVTLDDISIVLEAMLPDTEKRDPRADVNKDGKIDIKDLDIVTGAYEASQKNQEKQEKQGVQKKK